MPERGEDFDFSSEQDEFGEFESGGKWKWLVSLLVLVLLLGGGWYFYFYQAPEKIKENSLESYQDDEEDWTDEEDTPLHASPSEDSSSSPNQTQAVPETPVPAQAEKPERSVGVKEGIQSPPIPPLELQSPPDKTQKILDFSGEALSWEWKGGSLQSVLKLSQDKTFQKNVKSYPTTNHKLTLNSLEPGTWYWKVESQGENSPVREFRILPPPLRQMKLLLKEEINKNELLTWEGDEKIAYYRLEFFPPQGGAEPLETLATSGTQMPMGRLKLPQGSYQVRLGAFSEVSGRWEYTSPILFALKDVKNPSFQNSSSQEISSEEDF